MIIHTRRYFRAEQIEEIEKMGEAHLKEFTKWMLPFYKPYLQAALERGTWKASLTPGESAIWVFGGAGLRVLLGGDSYAGERWLHVSISRENGRLPTWADMVAVKETFLGAETQAYQVFAPRSQWVNDTANVLHLYFCLDGDMLPDFRITIPGGHKSI